MKRWWILAAAVAAGIALALLATKVRAPTPRGGPLAVVLDLADDVDDAVAHQLRARDDDEKVSPFEDVEWPAEGGVRVLVGGAWYSLEAIDNWDTADILALAERKAGRDRVRKRFEEDLPWLMREGGHPVERVVNLRLRPDGGGPVVERATTMTRENRQRFWQKNALVPAAGPGPVSAGDAATALRALADELESRHSYTVARGEGPRLRAMIDAELAKTPAPTIDQAAMIAARVIGSTADGHAGVESPEALERSPWLPYLFVPLRDEPGSDVVALLPDRSGFVDSDRPCVLAINGFSIERWLSEASGVIPDGSPALVRERACRLLRSAWVSQSRLGDLTITLAPTAMSPVPTRTTLDMKRANAKPTYGEWPRRRSGWLEPGTAYLRIPEMRADDAFLNDLRADMERFRDCERLVIDVRGNAGGSRAALRLIAGMAMEPGTTPLIYNAARPLRLGQDDAAMDARLWDRYLGRAGCASWSEAERRAVESFAAAFKVREPGMTFDERFAPWYFGVVSPAPGETWWRAGRRIVVLTDHRCFSATDVFVMAMAMVPGVTIVGRPTAGGSGMAEVRTLAGGAMRVRLSTMVSFRADGVLLDGVGLTPTLLAWPVPTDFLDPAHGGTDTMLDAAVAELLRPEP